VVALFVAAMFLGFVLVDLIARALQARRAVVIRPGELLWKVPKGFYLSEGHTWLQPDASARVKVGADALVAHALGAVDKVVLPRPGELVKAGQPLFQLKYHRPGGSPQSHSRRTPGPCCQRPLWRGLDMRYHPH